MPSLSQSPILQALGYAIANSLWQMAMVWIVYVLLNSIFKFRSEIKFRIAVAAQIVGFSWFLVTLQFYYRQSSQALELAESIYLQSSDQPYIVASEQGSLLNYFIKAEQVLPYLSVAYLLLLVFLTIRWFRAYRYTQLVRLNGLHKIDVDWKLFVNKVAAQLGIKQKVRIFLSEIVQSPVTIGFLKPVILIPIASINHLTPQQLEAIILHELAHIRRHDYLLNIVLSIIEIGLFFNPFTRLITKSVSKERENSCDDWVLQYQYNPSMYAEALLRIAVLQNAPSMAMHAVKCKGELLSRVQRMVHQKDSRFNYRHQLTALLLMTGILASIAWFDPTTVRRADISSLPTEHPVVMEPLAARIDNPLFNPMFLLNNALKEEVNETITRVNETRTISNRRETVKVDNREIVLPRVLAPVAIENLRQIEKKLAISNKELNKALKQLPAHVKVSPGYTLHFDTLFLTRNMTFSSMPMLGQQDMYLQNLELEMQGMHRAQQAIEDAVKKGTLSKAMAKIRLAELTEAMKKLKEVKLPQVYGFAGSNFNGEFNFRNFFEAAEADEKKVIEDKRRAPETKGTNVRVRKANVDSIRHRLLANNVIKVPHQPSDHFVSVDEGLPYVVVDDRAIRHLTEQPKVVIRSQGSHPADVATTYIYHDFVDECEKANRLDRTKRVKPAATGKGKTKVTPSEPAKTKTRNVKASCTATTATISNDQPQTVVVEVHVQ